MSKAKRHRSPNYPTISLKQAVDICRKLFKEIQRHAVGIDVLFVKMGYTTNSSTAQRNLGALRAYGLLDDTKTDGDATVRLSHRALDVVADYSEGDEEWTMAIRAAALAPPIFKEVWERFDNQEPVEAELRRYLLRVRDAKFSDNAADDFIMQFRETLSFAKLSSSEIMDAKAPPDDEGIEDDADRGDDRPERNDSYKQKRRERRQVTAGRKEATYPMATGDVVLQWPDRISPEEAQDLDEWLDIMKRKLKRSIVEETDSPDESS